MAGEHDMSSSPPLRGEDLVFPDFDDIPVSTRTFTAQLNVNFDLDKISKFLPITKYVVVPKRRGRKKRGPVVDPNEGIAYGSIITVDYAGKIRGVNLKCKCSLPLDDDGSRIAQELPEDQLCSHCRKQRDKKNKKGFRNSFTVVMVLDKLVNFKVYRNGTFQMTGCRTHEHAEMCVKYIWNLIKYEKDMYHLRTGDCLDVIFVPAMRNIDFSLGFSVSRKKLHNHVTRNTDWYSLLEEDIGYTGANIQIPLSRPVTDMKLINVKLDSLEQEWAEGKEVSYMTYVNRIESPKDRNEKLSAERENTFLVFQSGKLIMSGCCAEFMRPAYYEFLDEIRRCYDSIREQLKAKEEMEDIASMVYAICAM